jgi:hypothetical protein
MPRARSEPDLIPYRGNIWTVDPGMPLAQAVAIGGGGPGPFSYRR